MKCMCWVFGCLAMCGVALAEDTVVPQVIDYQGRVYTDGQPFDGTGFFRFAVYDAAGAVMLWSNDGADPPVADVAVAVSQGLYHVRLGETPGMTPLTAGVFESSERVLRVWFDDGVHAMQQLAPDVPLSSAAYALQSLNASTLEGHEAADLEESEEITLAVAAHAADPGVHHVKTTSFAELADSATDAQIPDDITVNHADTSGNADTLDGLNSEQFLRSDVSDTMNGILEVTERIGIGTSNPMAKLSVIGEIRSTTDGMETEYAELVHDGSNAGLSWAGDGNLDIRYDGSTKITVDQAGKLGVGINAPSMPLDVNGSILVRGISGRTPHGISLVTSEESIRLPGSTSDYIISVQDGSGRVQHYWNSTTASNDYQFLTGSENAGMINWDPNIAEFALRWANGSNASQGDVIDWKNALSVDLEWGDIDVPGSIFCQRSIYAIGGICLGADVDTTDIFNVFAPRYVIDQSQLTTTGFIAGTDNHWQSFTAGVTGNLTAVELWTGVPAGFQENLECKIVDGTGINGTVLATTHLINTSVKTRIIRFDSPVAVTAGNVYTVVIKSNNSNHRTYADFTDPYAGGRSISTSVDLYFRTFMDSGTAPEPVIHVQNLTNNVGLHTDDPDTDLTINSDEDYQGMTLKVNDNSFRQGIRFRNSGTSFTWHLFRRDAGSNHADLVFANGASPDLSVLTNRVTFADGGNVGIGVDAPVRTLHVKDVIRLEPLLSPPSSPSEGDIFMDANDHKLKVYDGSTWKACW